MMKKTPHLEAVLEILKTAKGPLSVPEITTLLAKRNLTPNKTTLYRMLEKLNKEGTVESLLLDSKTTYYELKTHHHHHFTCQRCERVECISDETLEDEIHRLEIKLNKAGLQVQQHHFSLTGVCSACQ